MTVPFMNPRLVIRGGIMCDPSIGMLPMGSCTSLYRLFVFLEYFSFVHCSVEGGNLLGRHCVCVNFRRWWKLLAVWKEFPISFSVAFSHTMNQSSLKRTRVVIFFFNVVSY